MRSLAVWHTTLKEHGCEPLPANAPFHLEHVQQADPGRGFLIGGFGAKDKPTHVVIVNLDYQAGASATLTGPRQVKQFDALAGRWSKSRKGNAELHLPPGGGLLVRMEL